MRERVKCSWCRWCTSVLSQAATVCRKQNSFSEANLRARRGFFISVSDILGVGVTVTVAVTMLVGVAF